MTQSTVGPDRPKRAKTGGRVKGTPNKITSDLKEAILMAAAAAGGDNGMVGYLTLQATANPGPFLTLLGKVLPMQVVGDPDAPLSVVTRIELVAAKRVDSTD